tara:strand:- start:3200 stop:3352 length:153 start_codon:yes stop_codon:yes gene_type:complete
MIRNKKPAITTKWVNPSNYHWVVSLNKAVEELQLKITPLREGIKKSLKSL